MNWYKIVTKDNEVHHLMADEVSHYPSKFMAVFLSNRKIVGVFVNYKYLMRVKNP